MSTWDRHLLDILRNIFDYESSINLDQKSEFNEWIATWIYEEKDWNKKALCCKFHYDNIMQPLYSKLLYKYDREFIFNILQCVRCGINISPNSKSLKKCELLLNKLEQDFLVSNANDIIKINEKYPDIRENATFFENIGRAIFNYYNEQHYPLIMNSLSSYPFKEYYIYGVEKNINEQRLFFEKEFFDLVKLIISNENDKWLELLHGKIININKAISIHKNFIYLQKNNILTRNVSKIESILNDFLNYLCDMWKCSQLSSYNVTNDYSYVKYPNCAIFESLKCSKLEKDYFAIYEYCIYYMRDEIKPGERSFYILNDFLPSLHVSCWEDEEENEIKKIMSTI